MLNEANIQSEEQVFTCSGILQKGSSFKLIKLRGHNRLYECRRGNMYARVVGSSALYFLPL